MKRESLTRDERRRADNERSKSWATKDGTPWSDEDSVLLLEKWIMASPGGRDEEAISRELRRTIQSCRTRAEKLRDDLGVSQHYHRKNDEIPPEVCSKCFMAKSACGTCGCDE